MVSGKLPSGMSFPLSGRLGGSLSGQADSIMVYSVICVYVPSCFLLDTFCFCFCLMLENCVVFYLCMFSFYNVLHSSYFNTKNITSVWSRGSN